MSPSFTGSPLKMDSSLSSSSNSSLSLSNVVERNALASSFTEPSPLYVKEPSASKQQEPIPTRSVSASTPTAGFQQAGESSQTKRHSLRSPEEVGIDRPLSPATQPYLTPSLHKSITVLDAKSITQFMEKSTQHAAPLSPLNASMNTSSPYPGLNSPYQPMASASYFPSHRQGSISSVTLPTVNSPRVPNMSPIIPLGMQDDTWQTLCVSVLPLFNGEGVKGPIENLNSMFRRCLTDPISPQLRSDIQALLYDGMFTLNAKMFGVSDDKLLDRLVEQWSFFFTSALPYFEAVFLPLRTDVIYSSSEEKEEWDVRNMALQSFRDNVILIQTKRLQDVFEKKLFTDLGGSLNPAVTAAKMLQMISVLASVPDNNDDLNCLLSNLKDNWTKMMTKRDRRGFVGMRRTRPPESTTPSSTDWNSAASSNMFGTLS